ncbi:hypothetical protein TNCV_2427931 [Trichonephila clavipes]|nr:hypothetical protein TNCV_2427931 [Trichonephila clavipes]
MCCATVRDVFLSNPSLPCAQFTCPHVMWCTQVDAIVHVGPSYPPASNGPISALQLFDFVQQDYRFTLKIIHNISVGHYPSTVELGYLVKSRSLFSTKHNSSIFEKPQEKHNCRT